MFCRESYPDYEGPDGGKMAVARGKKRVEAGDTVAMTMMGQYYVQGLNGVPKNAAKGMKLWKDAAKLGDVGAHYQVARVYDKGFGFCRLKKDAEALFHLEVAVMGGHHTAWYALGLFEVADRKFRQGCATLDDIGQDGT